MSSPNIEANRQQQTALYGAPLGDLAQGVMAATGLSQRGLSQVLGLSAPMLSQLMSGRRIKIGNPTVVARLQELMLLQDKASELSPEELQEQLAWIRQSQVTLTDTAVQRAPDTELAVEVLAATGDAQALRTAAQALDPEHPLAQLLASAAELAGRADG